ncbi:hypothetical protein QBC34DRAFT_387533 [Podospora aff. communis PSN243]|uniref:F-box domain-containing protein n=1 Tax=Podospora aff. communis PSN243 TaxID=3040156 RepID=A0AAV9G4Y4_9PEZI|nr:hypothetical protein QBC34DRAFT_387533 [Podospora aff. communis PSN243]
MNSQLVPPSRPHQDKDRPKHTSTDPPRLSPLESMPFDIFLAVFSQPDLDFDYATVLNLKNTNSRFYRAIVPDAICPRDAKAAFYQRVETYHQHTDHLVCFSCWKLKERDAFPDSQRKGRRGKGSSDVRRQKERWCWECGPKEGRERLGGVRRGNERVYWCGQCESWNPRDRRCAVLPWGIVCGDLIRLETKRSRLERLPDAVFERVLGFLGYREKILLAATNKGLRKRIGDPAAGGSILERSEFLKEAENRDGNRFCCYGCWRLKDRNKFSDVQQRLTDLDRTWFFRRRCCACLQLFYGRGSDTDAGKTALVRFKKQGVCFRCKKMRFWDEECEGCVIRDAEAAEYARLGALKRQEREQRGEVDTVNVLENDEPGVVDWLDAVGLADPWPWAHSRVPPPVDEDPAEDHAVEPGEDDSWGSNLYPLLDDEDEWPGQMFVEWLRMVEGEDVAARVAGEAQTDQPLPSQVETEAPSGRRGFEVWLIYNRFLGRTTSDLSTAAALTVARSGEPSSTQTTQLTTTQKDTSDLGLDPNSTGDGEGHSRHRDRFLRGEMTPAEKSLYLRIQAFVDRQRRRRQSHGEQHQRRPSRILELVSERLRALGSRMTSRRTEMAT